MKINTLTKIFGGAIALATVFALSTSMTLAYQGDPGVRGSNYSPERHIEITKAFETNDYAAWAKLMADRGRVTEIINADNFSDFVKAHELAISGDLDGAKTIRAELGLGLGNDDGNGQGKHLKDGSVQRNGRGNRQGRNCS